MHGWMPLISESARRSSGGLAPIALFPPLRTAGLLLLATYMACQDAPFASASQPSTLEYQVKAAYLLNFTKFIEWPSAEPADSPFTVCLIGDDPFGPALDRTIQGESVNGHKVVVQRTGRGTTKGCQLIFVSKSEKNIREFLNSLGPGVLTVGEGESFLRDGGVIAFVLENRRVRFSVNLSATRNERLNLSSKLLAVARSVEN